MSTKTSATISKVGQRRQVVIPKEVCDEIGITEGDFIEVTSERGAVVIKPKKVVNPDDVLTPAEARMVRRGLAQIKRGDYITLEQLERDLERPARKRRRKATQKTSR